MVECIPSEDWKVCGILAAGASCMVAAGLNKHCRMLPGTYCEVHDEPTLTNTMTWQMHECIALGPTGNLQGSVKFYCLTTGRVLKCHSFTPMQMPDWVIKRVDAIWERKGQGRTFQFLNRQKEQYKWMDEVPKDDTDFQGLLKNEEEAVSPCWSDPKVPIMTLFSWYLWVHKRSPNQPNQEK
jgi:hypothetical protein